MRRNMVSILIPLTLGIFLMLNPIMSPDASAEEFSLRNKHVTMEINPDTGGVVRVVYNEGYTDPRVENLGAGIAGEGNLFVPLVTIGGKPFAVSEIEVKLADKTEKSAIMKSMYRPDNGELEWKRSIRLEDGVSGFHIDDEYVWRGDAPVEIEIGVRSRIDPRDWRRSIRTWAGGADESVSLVSRAEAGVARREKITRDRVFWRVIGQYGVGFCYAGDLPGGEVTIHLPPEDGQPLVANWTSAPVKMEVGQPLKLSAFVLVDDGGRQTHNPHNMALNNRTFVTVDARRCAETGESIPCAATLLSAEAMTGVVEFERTEIAPDGGERVLSIEKAEFSLEPGRGKMFLFRSAQNANGKMIVRAVMRDEEGRELSRDEALVIVGQPHEDDAEGLRIWRQFQDKIPTVEYKGSWEDIARRRSPNPAQGEPTEYQRKVWDYIDNNYPVAARYYKAAAAVKNSEPSAFMPAVPQPAAADDEEACMDIFFSGPDGPLNAFSKERSGYGMQGLIYEKFVPNEGLSFHTYMGYGVNSAGLSVTGASLNTDGHTVRTTERAAAERMNRGELVSPPDWKLMMLASCSTVEEGVKFLIDPNMPATGEINYLLVDRDGNAAHVYGWATDLHVRYPDDNDQRFFSVGNYPAEKHGDLFGIGDPGWSANSRMREILLWELAGHKRDEISLQDAIALMETHAAGGICQHGYDNPGHLFTCHSVIAVCRTSELLISHGPPCARKYYRFTLPEVEE